MYTLLAICLVLHPQRIDESLHSMLKEKNYAEKMNKMSQGDLSEFEASFNFACPKFLSPVPPSFDVAIGVDVGSLHKEPLRLQMNVFMDEVKQQLLLPTIRCNIYLFIYANCYPFDLCYFKCRFSTDIIKQGDLMFNVYGPKCPVFE